MPETTPDRKFQIFRAAQAPTLQAAELMQVRPFNSTQRAAVDRLIAAGYQEGGESRVLFNIPGFSLIHVRFKSGYPLLRHSHDSDCLYYIVAGSLKLGTELLGPCDGLFVPAGAPYTYRAGPDGVELLEFRHATRFDFVNLTNGEEFYNRALETVRANIDNWRQAKDPSR
jgi:hypothetical protein